MTQASQRTARLLLVAALSVAVLAGCSTVKNIFGGRGKDKSAEPTPLVQITPSVSVNRLWTASLGKCEEKLGIGQHPTILDGRVYAAAVSGGVTALDLSTGAVAWNYASDLPLSGGPGAG